VVSAAGAHATKVLLTVGGWTGSSYFSTIAADAALRAAFIGNLQRLVSQHKLDGIDIDWEYPGKAGASGNAVNPADSANLLVLLRELRASLGAGKEISMAVGVQPFVGSDGNPMADVSAYTPFLDRINVMAYDVNGAWSHQTGPNAPLNGATSATGSIKAWAGAGFPAAKLMLGLPFYGRSVQLASPVSAPVGNALGLPIQSTVPRGDKDDAMSADPCPGAVSSYSGVWQWRNLRAQGVLSGVTMASSGWTRGYDTASATPWLINPAQSTFISYDDPQSMQLKVSAAKCAGTGGVMLWDLHQDNGELMGAVTQAMQASAAC